MVYGAQLWFSGFGFRPRPLLLFFFIAPPAGKLQADPKKERNRKAGKQE